MHRPRRRRPRPPTIVIGCVFGCQQFPFALALRTKDGAPLPDRQVEGTGAPLADSVPISLRAGSIAIAALARLGYEVTAISGKDDARDYLTSLGARDILSRTTLVMGTRPLETARWAGAIDAVGGDMLAWLTRTTNYWGGIASTGLTGGVELRTTVMPFILRGVSLIGIDSAMCPMPVRSEVWRRLATDMKPADLNVIAHEITLDGLPAAFDTLIAGKARGRFVVNLRT